MRKKQGTIVSVKNDKTVVVRTDRYVAHPKYGKRYRISKKFHAHDEKNEASVGDIVEISETRPVSKLKCWKLNKIISKSAQAVISKPSAVESEKEAELKEFAQVEKEIAPDQIKKEAENKKKESVGKAEDNDKEEIKNEEFGSASLTTGKMQKEAPKEEDNNQG